LTKRLSIAAVAAGAVALAAGWALFRPELLFIDRTVNEDFPAAVVRPATNTRAETQVPSGAPMPETMPLVEAKALLSGTFRAGAHDGVGVATIYELDAGRRMLRLTDFETSNGPDLRVLLVAAPEANDSDAVTKAGYTILAKLKGNRGDQNYELPADLDLEKHRTVCIWCHRFGVNFTSAPLR